MGYDLRCVVKMGFLDKVGDFFSSAGEGIVDFFTGGVSREARESLDSIEDTSQKAGAAIGMIAGTVERLGRSLGSLIDDDIGPLIEDINDLFVIERLTPRDYSDLWDEEKERLDGLNEKRDEVRAQIDKLRAEIKTETGVEIPNYHGNKLQRWIKQNIPRSLWECLFNGFNIDTYNSLGESGRRKVRQIQSIAFNEIKIEKEIHEILYNDAGVLPTVLYDTKEILERFNTIEQPKVEDILDSADDNLIESKEILEQVKKLFVIKKRVPIHESEMSQSKLDRLTSLRDESRVMESSINKDLKLSKELMDFKAEIQPSSLNPAIAKTHLFDINYLNSDIKKEIEGSTGNKKIPGDLKDAFKKNKHKLSDGAKILKVSDTDWEITDNRKKYLIRESDNRLNIYSTAIKLTNPTISGEHTNNSVGVSTNLGSMSDTSNLGSVSTTSNSNTSNIAIARGYMSGYLSGPNVSKAIKQPRALKLSSGLTNSKYTAYGSRYSLQKAYIKLQERELGKLRVKIEKIKYKETDEPGVIPRMLDRLEDILKRFNTEEQPKVETILDSVNGNLTESKKVMNNVNTTFERVSGFVDGNNLLLKIFFGVAAIALAITFVSLPLLMIRMILFGL